MNIPAPTGDRVHDLLEERRATIREMRGSRDAMAEAMLAADVDRIDRELAALEAGR